MVSSTIVIQAHLYIISGFVNNPPAVPSIPSGPTVVYVNTTYPYTTSTTDPDPDEQLSYQFNFHGWHLDEYTGWFGPYSSGETMTLNHVFPERRWLEIRVRACDKFHVMSGWSGDLGVTVVNRGPTDPVITGPTSVIRGDANVFKFVSTDLDNDSVRFEIQWGDGSSEFTNYVHTGTIVEISHTFNQVQTFTVKARAQDNYGYVGNYSNWTSSNVQVQREFALGKVTGNGSFRTGGIIGVNILNFRNTTGLTDTIYWQIRATGGILGLIDVNVTGNITNPGLTKIFPINTQPKKIYGLGVIYINITATLGAEKLEKTLNGFIILWKVIIKDE